MRAGHAWLLVGVLPQLACSPDVPLLFTPVDVAECAAFCADALEVRVAGELRATVPCGAPIELAELASGEVVELEVTTVGSGLALRGRVELTPAAGDEVAASLSLAPTQRPVIGSVTPRLRRGLIGEADLVIEGVRLGPESGAPRGRSEVRVGGLPVEVEPGSWTANGMVVRTPRVGDVVVEQCGVASEPVDSGLYTPTLETLEPFGAEAMCPLGRMVGVAALDVGTAAQPFGVFACGADACGTQSTTLIGRLPRNGPRLESFWRPPGRCPRALGQYAERRVYLADAGRLAQCELSAQDAGGDIDCARLATPVDLRAASSTSADAAYLVGEAAGNQRPLRYWDGARTSTLALEAIDFAVALEGRYVLGRKGNVVSLHVLRGGEILRSAVVPDCPTARRLAVVDPWVDASPAVAVACTGGASSKVHIFDFTRRTDAPITDFTLEGLAPTRIALTVEGDRLLVWDHAGGDLGFFDVATGRELARLELLLDFVPQDMEMVRAARADVFYFGGPGPGQIRRLDLDIEAP